MLRPLFVLSRASNVTHVLISNTHVAQNAILLFIEDTAIAEEMSLAFQGALVQHTSQCSRDIPYLTHAFFENIRKNSCRMTPSLIIKQRA